MLKSIFVFPFVAKVLLDQFCFIIGLIIAKLKIILANSIVTVNVNHLLVLRRKHLRNLIMANYFCSKIMHQNNTLKDTPAFLLI